jgi:bifunctional non-homologous end joining protein LigD
VHFDLDPGEGATWEQVLECARIVHDALTSLDMPSLVKTTGSKGLHLYVPIVRGPVQKQVWTFAKALALELASRHPTLMTAEYRVAKRPYGRVLVDYNQNAWGRTLASFTRRARGRWHRVDAGDLGGLGSGASIDDFTIQNVRSESRSWATLEGRITRGHESARATHGVVTEALAPEKASRHVSTHLSSLSTSRQAQVSQRLCR